MKQQTIVYFLIMSVGIGAAMSVALHDTAMCMAIGFGVGIVFTYSDQTSCHTQKSNHETESK